MSRLSSVFDVGYGGPAQGRVGRCCHALAPGVCPHARCACVCACVYVYAYVYVHVHEFVYVSV